MTTDERETPFVTQRATVGSGASRTTGGIREAVARKRGEVDAEQEKLDEQKRLLRLRAQNCEAAEAKLRERAAEVAKRKEQFEKLEEESEAKMAVVAARTAEEHAIATALEQEVREKEAELERLGKVKQETAALVDSLAPCQRFLQRVIESSDEFPTIAEVLNRHDTLVKAHKVSENAQRRQKEEIAVVQAEIASLAKKRTETVFILEAEMSAKKAELEEERARSEELQGKLQSDSKVAVERLRLHGELLMSIKNLCARMELEGPLSGSSCSTLSSSSSSSGSSDDLAVVVSRLGRLSERLADLHDIVAGYEEGDESPAPASK